MKVVFINCAAEIDPDGKIISFNRGWIHHGLASISAYIKSKGYTDVSCINLWKLNTVCEFREIISESASDADVFGVSINSLDCDSAIKCIKIIKELNPKSIIVVGGPHPTLMLHEVEPYPEIDYIITGEGEISFANLLDDLKASKTPDRVIRGIRPNVEDLPFIDDTLMGRIEPPYLPILPRPFLSIITCRGCMYNCKFCQPASKIMFGKKVQRRSVKNVIAELKIMREKYDFKSFIVLDDCLTEDKKWIDEFCDEYIKHGFNQPFVIQSRVDFICKNEHLVEKLAKAGLKAFSIGFESGSQRLLNFLNKGTTVEQNIHASEICHKYDIKVKGNIMLGSPTETNEEAQETLAMVKKLNAYMLATSFYTPQPGSDLYKYCEDHGISLIKQSADLNRVDQSVKKIKGIDYDFLAHVVEEIRQCFTYSGDNILDKINSLPDIDISNAKILAIRSAPVEFVKTFIGQCMKKDIPMDFIVQENVASEFKEYTNIRNIFIVDHKRVTAESLSDLIPVLRMAQYNIALIPLNTYNYHQYAEINMFIENLKIKHIWGITRGLNIVELNRVLV